MVVLGGGAVSYERGTPAGNAGVVLHFEQSHVHGAACLGETFISNNMARQYAHSAPYASALFVICNPMNRKAHRLVYHSTLGSRVIKKQGAAWMREAFIKTNIARHHASVHPQSTLHLSPLRDIKPLFPEERQRARRAPSQQSVGGC